LYRCFILCIILRINKYYVGYGLTISMLLFVGAVEILWENLFTLHTSYCLNLIAIAIIAWGATSKNVKYMLIKREDNFNLFYIFFCSPTIQFLWLHQYTTYKIHTGRYDWRKCVKKCLNIRKIKFLQIQTLFIAIIS